MQTLTSILKRSPSDKVYRADRDSEGTLITVSTQDPPSTKPVYWGNHGSDPVKMAFYLLSEEIGLPNASLYKEQFATLLPVDQNWRMTSREVRDHLQRIQTGENDRGDHKGLTPANAFWMMYLVLVTLAVFVTQRVHADGGTFTPPTGGDCYAAKKHPTTRTEARIRDERWTKLVLSEKLAVAGMVGRGKAEWLYLPATDVCGPPAGDLKVYGTWYWRLK